MQMNTLTTDVKNIILSYLDKPDIKIIKSKNVFNGWKFEHFIKLGYLNIVKWIYKNMGGLSYINIIILAAKHGHLNILQWIFIKDSIHNHLIIQYATQYKESHLHILQWARANGCAWNSNVCADAALWGNLDIWQWALANGCGYHPGECANCAEYGRDKALLYKPLNKQLIANYDAIIDWLNQH